MLSNFTISQPINALAHLVFPNLCVACGISLPPSIHCFCFSCQGMLLETNMHMEKENVFDMRMWMKLRFEKGAAMYLYRKKSPIQRALHKLKYKNRPDIGEKLGRKYGFTLKKSKEFSEIDYITPVPLHPKKLHSRGYNQSLMFAKGLSESLEIPVVQTLERLLDTTSQTQKTAMVRNQGLENVFGLKARTKTAGKKILLVDDVLTSGATLEHCGNALVTAGAQLSFATIAIAMH